MNAIAKAIKVVNTGKTLGMIGWDWKDQPDEVELNSILNSHGIYVRYGDIGDDTYVLVFSNKPLTGEHATKVCHQRI